MIISPLNNFTNNAKYRRNTTTYMKFSLAIRDEIGKSEAYILETSLEADENGAYNVRLHNDANELIHHDFDVNFDTLSARIGNYISDNIGKVIDFHDIQADESTSRALKLIRYLNHPNN